MPIRTLPTLLVNQIAAGEVIERPASVVKELVENSLDAGATRIDVAVEDGGRQLIRVSDDGRGVPPEELTLAVAPHATSKISRPEDLASIVTLGFRGEALASIASVSRLRLTSRATVEGATAEAAALIEAGGPDVTGPSPAAAAPGTVVEVRDLFFNTPARRKFLRAAASEFSHVNEIVTRLAMAHPQVAFTLAHNGRKVIDLAGNGSQRQRCVELLGKELDEALLEFQEMFDVRCAMCDVADVGAARSSSDIEHRTSHIAHPILSIWGLAGLPAIARATARFQYLCVNGRFVRDRGVSHAIKEAYRGLIPPDKQPMAVVFLQLDPTLVDVNVRFREPQRVHGLVLNALRQRLLASDLTPRATFAISDLRFAVGEKRADDAATTPGGGAIANRKSQIANQPLPSASEFVDYFRRMAPQQRGFVYDQVKEAMREEGEGLLSVDVATANVDPAIANRKSQVANLPPVLQVHKSYLVTQDEQGLIIVDQHALHERVMFEELRQRVLGRNLESQRLLMPEVLEATPGRLAALDDIGPLLERIGVEAEPIGPASIAIQAFPTFLFDRKVAPGPFLADLLDRAEAGDFDVNSATALEDAMHEVLDMMACKAAVKAGDQMSGQELAALLAKRDQIERASNCPHGRPTTIRLSLRDLEKQFKRT
jgi:DNA mismatch repair protein MutL